MAERPWKFESSRPHQSVLRDARFYLQSSDIPQSGAVPRALRRRTIRYEARDAPRKRSISAQSLHQQKPASMGRRRVAPKRWSAPSGQPEQGVLVLPTMRKVDGHQALTRQPLGLIARRSRARRDTGGRTIRIQRHPHVPAGPIITATRREHGASGLAVCPTAPAC